MQIIRVKNLFPTLSLPPADLQIRSEKRADSEAYSVYDERRAMWVPLTPEEWVRQHVLNYLIEAKGYSPTLIRVEQRVWVNRQPQRVDILVYSTHMQPHLLIECKAAHVRLSKETIWQIATYNSVLNAPFLAITNGLTIATFQKTTNGISYYSNDFPQPGLLRKD